MRENTTIRRTNVSMLIIWYCRDFLCHYSHCCLTLDVDTPVVHQPTNASEKTQLIGDGHRSYTWTWMSINSSGTRLHKHYTAYFYVNGCSHTQTQLHCLKISAFGCLYSLFLISVLGFSLDVVDVIVPLQKPIHLPFTELNTLEGIGFTCHLQ